MVILFVTPFLRSSGENPKGGGLEAYLLRVAGALKKLGHMPIIVSLGDKDIHDEVDGIEVIFVQYARKYAGTENMKLFCRRISRSLTINRKIRQLLQERNIDIIQFASVEGLAACYYGRTPAVMRMSSYAKTYYKECEDFSRTRLYLWSLFERFAARRCNALFAPSNVIADDFSKDIHRPVPIIETPFWNDCEACDDSVYREQLFGKKYFLFIGRLDYEKGILVIADILQKFLQDNPDYYFVCCGAPGVIYGKNSVRILQKAAGQYKEKFIYMQVQPHKTLYPIIQHADFVICPSIMDNFSNACMEAMYFRRVVIGTDGTSYEQLIEDGKSGLLCRPGDAEELLRKMQQAANMYDIQKAEMGRQARKRIDKLSPEITVKKLVRYYQYIIDNVHK